MTLTKAPYLASVVTVLFITLPMATKAIFRIFICMDFEDGTLLILHDVIHHVNAHHVLTSRDLASDC